MQKPQSSKSRNNFYPKEKACVGCGTAYIMNSNTQKYCTEKCRLRHKPGAFVSKEISCKMCNTKFMTERPTQVYCGEDCRYEAKSLWTKNNNKLKTERRRQEAKEKSHPLVECGYSKCKRIFEKKRDQYKYCSSICRYQAKKEKDQAAFVKRLPKRKCAWPPCQEEFMPLNLNHKYCRKTCHERARSVRDAQQRKDAIKKRVMELAQKGAKSCLGCKKENIAKSDPRQYCPGCWDLRQKAKKEGRLFNSPDGSIYNEVDAADFFKQSWKQLSNRHHIDTTPTAMRVEDSDFRAEIEAFLKKGGEIKKLKVGFAQTPIIIERNVDVF